MSYSFLVHYILCTLPHHYASFKIMCVQEKEMLLMEEDKRVNLTTFEKHKRNQVNHKGRILAQPVVKKESKCFFYKKKGHMKKDCPKFKNWLEKKGSLFAFVCYESNTVNVNYNTWWIDPGSTIHVSNTLQGMKNLRRLVGNEQFIYLGSKVSSHVEAVGTCN